MKWKDWLEKWEMNSLKLKTPFLEMNWNPVDEDIDAAWDLYIELLTRVSTQYLPIEHGDETTALDSIFSLFALTRDIIKDHGRKCIEFTKIAIVVLNQVIRPFTAKWHKLSLAGAFADQARCEEFRIDLGVLQQKLRNYSRMLSEMANVEDLTNLEGQA